MYTRARKNYSILIAEDDPDDIELIKLAFKENGLSYNIFFVNDGEEVISYLDKSTAASQLPNIIILDLNMPKKDGKETLKYIKTNPSYKNIPVIILTTSNSEKDIIQCYDLGANSFIVKPSNFQDYVEIAQTLHKFWFKVAITVPGLVSPNFALHF